MSTSDRIRDNVLYSVLDYASQPALMLAATPYLLRELGAQQYGLWMLVNSIAATAGGLGGGFGDGATKYVAMYRGRGDRAAVIRSLAAVLAVHSGFGAIAALAMVCLAPMLVGHVFAVEPALLVVGIAAVRISAVLLFVRFIESVFVAAIRGCERYRSTVIISVVCRIVVTGAAIALAAVGYNLGAILWATLIVASVGLCGQMLLAHRFLPIGVHWHTIDLRAGIREVTAFGAFTWIKSSLGILTAYADRLLVAAVLGTGPLAYYALCNQLTQPVPALLAAAFSFIFPNFSALSGSSGLHQAQSRYRTANLIAFTAAGLACIVFVAGASPILRLWLGPAIALRYHGLLRVVAIGNCLLALTVVPQYAALAFGRARAVTIVSFVAGAFSLPASYLLMQRLGLLGAGLGKALAGILFLSMIQVGRRAIDFQARTNTKTSADLGAALDLAR